MANILQAFQAVQTMTVTSLTGLVSSVTAGWQSAVIDNSANLYTGYAFEMTLTAVNTAPSSQKALYVYLYRVLDTATSNYTTTGAASGGAPSGSVGALTFPDITANAVNMPLLTIIPYTGQNAAIIAQWTASAADGGLIFPKLGLGIINATGMTIGTATLKYRGYYNTVA